MIVDHETIEWDKDPEATVARRLDAAVKLGMLLDYSYVRPIYSEWFVADDEAE